ncbi:hypothetical protein DERF_013228 [Dermatophagoides farinae]|uniref:Uncharacterized protein n=1 Tax=Dermatophagoides farinae TaxID=6954 RepID=A0A922HQR9_DERFA|nr:hypothetical protein DERF_013228 [Dermatophagoides farinae]
MINDKGNACKIVTKEWKRIDEFIKAKINESLVDETNSTKQHDNISEYLDTWHNLDEKMQQYSIKLSIKHNLRACTEFPSRSPLPEPIRMDDPILFQILSNMSDADSKNHNEHQSKLTTTIEEILPETHGITFEKACTSHKHNCVHHPETCTEFPSQAPAPEPF